MNPLQYIILGLIVFYQRVLSPDQGFIRIFYPFTPQCTMYPTCSAYTKIAVQKYGAIVGVFCGIKRIIRCHPGQKQLIDHP